jgi:glycosyltransferase involved in cell wall biosynthesis
MGPPSILVVMPTLGIRHATLPRALDSVRAQHGVDARLVVVMPEGARQARAVVTAAGADIVDDPGRGLSAAVNAGLAARNGEEFFAWLNDDDYFLPGGLQRVCSMLAARADAVVAYGACVYIDERDRTLGVNRAGHLAHKVQTWGPNLLPQPAAVCRLSEVLAAGGYDETLRYAMDLDMFLRLRRRGAFVATRDQIATFRWHAESISVNSRRDAVAEAQQVKRRHLGPRVRRVAPLWDGPVRWATLLAGVQLARRAKQVGRG